MCDGNNDESRYTLPVNVNPTNLPVLLLFNLDYGWSSREQEEVIKTTAQLGEAISSVGHRTTLVAVSNGDLDAVLDSYDPRENVVLNWCEGVPGNDHSEWQVARSLEAKGFAFTGADSDSLILAQDKYRVKQIMDRSGIPTPVWKLFEQNSEINWDRFPAIVKPVSEHCSEGIDRYSIVLDREELEKRVRYVHEKYRQPAIVEDFIDGRELHVSLWGNGHIEMLPPVEMEFSYFKDIHDRICSYEAKFVPGSDQYEHIQSILPAPLSQDELQKIEKICQAAYRAAACRDYARIDLRMKDGEYYILDVNPNADISADASTASAAEYVGYSYGEFGSRLVRLAARRHPVWGDHH